MNKEGVRASATASGREAALGEVGKSESVKIGEAMVVESRKPNKGNLFQGDL